MKVYDSFQALLEGAGAVMTCLLFEGALTRYLLVSVLSNNRQSDFQGALATAFYKSSCSIAPVKQQDFIASRKSPVFLRDL
jgi:hypothetical protein